MYIWKREYAPMRMGGPTRRAIKTKIKIEEYKVIDLGHGFQGIYIPDEGVFELTSGGLVGDTVDDVIHDIHACDDLTLMHEQIKIAKKERDTIAIEVSNDVFFAK